MKWNDNNIDQWGRSALGNLEKEPPPLAFRKIRKRVLWYSFWTLGAGSLIRRIGVFTGIAAIVFFSGWWLLRTTSNSIQQHSSMGENNGKHLSNTALSLQIPSEEHANEMQNITSPTFISNPQQQAPSRSQAENQSVSESLNLVQSGETQINNQFASEQQPVSTEKQIAAISANTKKDEIFELPTQISMLSQNEIVLHQDFQPNFKTYTTFTPIVKPVLSAGIQTNLLTSGPFSVFSQEQTAGISSRFSPEFGGAITLRADLKGWHVSGGIQYNSFSNNYHSENLLYNGHTEFTLQQTNQFWEIDTSGFWHYTWVSDSIIHISDSVWVWEYDSTLITQYDSISASAFDTLKNAKWGRTIKALEFPISAGYSWQHGTLSYGFAAAVIPGFIIQQKGNIYAGINGTSPFIIYASTESFQFTLGVMASGTLSWHFQPRWAIDLSVLGRKQLLIQSDETDATQPFMSGGLSAGLRYFF